MSRALASSLFLCSALCVFIGCSSGGNNTSGQQQQTNPLPQVAAITPSSVLAGSPSQTITLTGSGFISGSTAAMNGTMLQTAYTNSTTLQATVPSALLSNGQAETLTVTNPAPGGGTSGSVGFNVTAPTPLITSISPTYLLQSTPVVLVVTGSGFEANSTVIWNGTSRATSFVSPTALQVSLSASDVSAIGGMQVAVNNPGPGGTTTAASSVVVYAAPTITSLSPTTATAGALSLQIAVTGTNFQSDSVVTVDGAPQLTTFGNSTSLMATVSAAALATGRTANVTVRNPAPTAGDSNASPLSITTPAPILTVLTPASVLANAATTITLTGTGFVSNTSVTWNGSARTTTYVSPTSLKVALTATDLQNGGTGQIAVTNPTPGGGTSAPLPLLVVIPPTISSVTPSTVQASSSYTATGSTTFTLAGSNFASGATVTLSFYTETVTSQTPTQLVVSVPNSQLYTTGTMTFTAFNPGTGTTRFGSEGVTVNVINPSAAFTVSPSSAQVGSAATTISLYGSGFFADSVVNWNGTPLATTYSTTSSITAAVPASLLASLGTATISVSTPENLGATTPTQNFTTYLGLAANDLAWNPVDSLIYATVPSTAGALYGNSLVGIDPNTGSVVKTIFVGSEPTKLALSTDGTQAFVGLNGAAAVRQVDITKNVAGVQWGLGGGPGVYNAPYTASGIAAMPGQPNSVAVYSDAGVVTIYDSGVARAKTSSGLNTYFTSNYGGLAFGSSANTLYLSASAVSNYVYQLSVDATGITTSKSLPSIGAGVTLQYDAGRLYFTNGVVADATTGNSLGQFSVASSYSTTPVAASGPTVSESALNRAWVLVTNGLSSATTISAFDETTFNLVGSIPVPSVSSTTFAPSRLIRWGQNGLAFNSGNQLYILKTPLVKDNSSTPVDLQVAANAPATVTTGSSFATQFKVSNAGPNGSVGTSLTVVLPASLIQGTVSTTQGSCTGSGTVLCDLGGLASGSNSSVTVNATATSSGTVQLTGTVDSQSFDSDTSNNQRNASITASGGLYSPVPSVSSLSPNLVAAGSATYMLTVTGTGFTTASTVNWNGTPLPTSLSSSNSLTATVDSSLVKNLGWGTVTVSSAAPGGGSSQALTESIYSLVPVSANAMVYDPYKRVLWTVLPSTSASPTGNSLVSIDPLTGTVGTPIDVGSEPNMISETTSGNYLWIGLSGADSLGRFNLASNTLDATLPLASTGYFGGAVAASAVIALPGTDTSVAVPNTAIYDFSGATATARPNSALGYSDAQFTDASHAFTFDNYSTGAEFYRYTVDASGVHSVDGTTLNGMGGFLGGFAIDGGIGFGAAGGVFNPFSSVPSMIGQMNLGAGPYSSGLSGGGVVPYAAEKKSFNVAINSAGSWLVFLERCNIVLFECEDMVQLPTGNQIVEGAVGTRWGQDGLAYILTPGVGSTGPSQVMLLRGPFVLPSEASVNAAPTLAKAGTGSLGIGSGNQRITVTGTGFLPGASVMWSGIAHDTAFMDAQTLTVAVSAAEVSTAATLSVTVRNPGSTDSNAVSVAVK